MVEKTSPIVGSDCIQRGEALEPTRGRDGGHCPNLAEVVSIEPRRGVEAEGSIQEQ